MSMSESKKTPWWKKAVQGAKAYWFGTSKVKAEKAVEEDAPPPSTAQNLSSTFQVVATMSDASAPGASAGPGQNPEQKREQTNVPSQETTDWKQLAPMIKEKYPQYSDEKIRHHLDAARYDQFMSIAYEPNEADINAFMDRLAGQFGCFPDSAGNYQYGGRGYSTDDLRSAIRSEHIAHMVTATREKDRNPVFPYTPAQEDRSKPIAASQTGEGSEANTDNQVPSRAAEYDYEHSNIIPTPEYVGVQESIVVDSEIVVPISQATIDPAFVQEQKVSEGLQSTQEQTDQEQVRESRGAIPVQETPEKKAFTYQLSESDQRKMKALAPLIYFVQDAETLAAETRGYNPYDVIFGIKNEDLRNKTINEVLAMQDDIAKAARDAGKEFYSTASGALQSNKANLSAYKKQLGLTGYELFDETMQDYLTYENLRYAGLDQFLAGTMTTDRFVRRISGVWASIPKNSANEGTHDGVGPNGTTVDYNEVIRVLGQTRESYQLYLQKEQEIEAKAMACEQEQLDIQQELVCLEENASLKEKFESVSGVNPRDNTQTAGLIPRNPGVLLNIGLSGR